MSRYPSRARNPRIEIELVATWDELVRLPDAEPAASAVAPRAGVL
jgi:hypothetical protein